MIQQNFKKYANLSDFECRFKFLELLKLVYRYDQERFRCALGVSWATFSIVLAIFRLGWATFSIGFATIFCF